MYYFIPQFILSIKFIFLKINLLFFKDIYLESSKINKFYETNND